MKARVPIAARRVLRRLLTANLLADRRVRSLPTDVLTHRVGVPHAWPAAPSSDVAAWAERFVPHVAAHFGVHHHKKVLELFLSFRLVDIREEHVYLDAAGAASATPGRLRPERG